MSDNKELFSYNSEKLEIERRHFQVRHETSHSGLSLIVVCTVKGSGGFLCFEILWMVFWKLRFSSVQFIGLGTKITEFP